MKKKILSSVLLIIVLVIGYVAYLWFQPHRDVVATEADAEVNATALVDEFLNNAETAQAKYLDAEGQSKILIVSGIVTQISTDQLGQKVVQLKSAPDDELGVACTFTLETNQEAEGLKVGDQARIKGVIRSGAEYDEDLELGIDAVLEKSTLVK